MREITKVKIDKLIVHILERKRKVMVDGKEKVLKRLVLSDRCAPLDPKSELAKFFGDHIVESLEDASAKAALFKKPKKKDEDPGEEPQANEEKNLEDDPDSNPDSNPDSDPDSDPPKYPALEVCRDILQGEMDFVSGSQDLAKRLWQVMKKNKNISDGDLAICLFHAVERRKLLDEDSTKPLDEDSTKPLDEDSTKPLDGGSDEPLDVESGESEGVKSGESYLAIIKLEPVGAFRNMIEGQDTEETTVVLVSDPYVFPRRTDTLQKGAYVQSVRDDQKFHLLLVDKQQYGGIAKFFTEDFLGAEYVEDAAEKTRRLYGCLISTLNDIRPVITSDQDLYLGEAIYQIFDKKYPKVNKRTGEIIAKHQVFDEDRRFNVVKWVGKLVLPIDEDVDAEEDEVNPENIKLLILKKVKDCMEGKLKIERNLALTEDLIRRRKFSTQYNGNFSFQREGNKGMIKSVKRIGKKYVVIFETNSFQEKWR